jgi:hypothetical protein
VEDEIKKKISNLKIISNKTNNNQKNKDQIWRKKNQRAVSKILKGRHKNQRGEREKKIIG